MRLLHRLLIVISCLSSAATYADMKHLPDLPFAHSGERDLLLDLYLPEQASAPLIVWLHGGIWRFGTKEDIDVLDIVNQGFALASIGFRNSDEAQFPAQIHDIKAAIRYLRAHAEEYGYNSEAIVVWGYSSGAHLAALTGVTNGSDFHEGTLGEHLDHSSTVQAIIDYSGPANLHSILHQSTEHGVSVRGPGMKDLLGKAIDDPAIQALATQASPALLVDEKSPPILIMHGVQDNQVPINQSIELQLAYQRAGRYQETEWLQEAQHTSGEYFRSPYLEQAAAFIRLAINSNLQNTTQKIAE